MYSQNFLDRGTFSDSYFVYILRTSHYWMNTRLLFFFFFLQLAKFLKDEFTQKLKLCHYLLTLMLMESQVKFRKRHFWSIAAFAAFAAFS